MRRLRLGKSILRTVLFQFIRQSVTELRPESVQLLSFRRMLENQRACFHRFISLFVPENTQLAIYTSESSYKETNTVNPLLFRSLA